MDGYYGTVNAAASPLPLGGREGGGAAGKTVPSADPDERIRQLQTWVAELAASERKLATERDIVPRAGTYVAGETCAVRR